MGIYQSIYALIEQYVYGGMMSTDSALVTTLLATCGCLFVVALPFAVVWKIIKLIVGG